MSGSKQESEVRGQAMQRPGGQSQCPNKKKKKKKTSLRAWAGERCRRRRPHPREAQIIGPFRWFFQMCAMLLIKAENAGQRRL